MTKTFRYWTTRAILQSAAGSLTNVAMATILIRTGFVLAVGLSFIFILPAVALPIVAFRTRRRRIELEDSEIRYYSVGLEPELRLSLEDVQSLESFALLGLAEQYTVRFAGDKEITFSRSIEDCRTLVDLLVERTGKVCIDSRQRASREVPLL